MKLLNIYADHNFLINCANKPALRIAAAEAAKSDKIKFVLSPWHFYEIGRIKEEWRRELLTIIDELRPSWILERYDLQLAEFKEAWEQFWGRSYAPLVPIGSLE